MSVKLLRPISIANAYVVLSAYKDKTGSTHSQLYYTHPLHTDDMYAMSHILGRHQGTAGVDKCVAVGTPHPCAGKVEVAIAP